MKLEQKPSFVQVTKDIKVNQFGVGGVRLQAPISKSPVVVIHKPSKSDPNELNNGQFDLAKY